jgi:hypothetical protein
LRLLRAFSLISRRSLTAGPELLSLCGAAAPLLAKVPLSRIWCEWRAWAESEFPHLGLRFLEESGLLRLYPELFELTLSPQGWRFHPEGSVWNHTVLAVQAMAELRLPEPPGKLFDRGLLALCALVHDVGKNSQSRQISPDDGRICYPGHAESGSPYISRFLASIGCPDWVRRPVLKLARAHMEGSFRELASWDLKRIARTLAPEADLADFWAVKSADWNGRLYWPERYPLDLDEFLAPVGGSLGAPPDILNGRDLMELFGLPPGPELGRLLERLREAGDQGELATRWEAAARAERLIKGGLAAS